MIAWKVVKKQDDKKLTSSIITGPLLSLIYTPGKITRAPEESLKKGFGICCFKTGVKAREYAARSTDFQAWKVELIDEIPVPEHRISIETSILRIHTWKGLWRRLTSSSSFFPYGTVMGKAVRLIERA